MLPHGPSPLPISNPLKGLTLGLKNHFYFAAVVFVLFLFHLKCPSTLNLVVVFYFACLFSNSLSYSLGSQISKHLSFSHMDTKYHELPASAGFDLFLTP